MWMQRGKRRSGRVVGARTATRRVHLGSLYYGIEVKICLEFFVMVKRGMIIRGGAIARSSLKSGGMGFTPFQAAFNCVRSGMCAPYSVYTKGSDFRLPLSVYKGSLKIKKGSLKTYVEMLF